VAIIAPLVAKFRLMALEFNAVTAVDMSLLKTSEYPGCMVLAGIVPVAVCMEPTSSIPRKNPAFARQTVNPVSELELSGHGTHAESPVAPPNVPGAQDSQVVGLEAPVAAENVPAAQRVQKVELDAPAVTEYRPVVQAVQTEELDAPVVPENEPAVQRVQLVRAATAA
jgi:hypothetical protein